MEKDLIHQVSTTHPKLAIALVIVTLITGELASLTSLPDILILTGRLVSYALASWGSIELIKYYRAKRKSLK